VSFDDGELAAAELGMPATSIRDLVIKDDDRWPARTGVA
jgi:hypothetical protein